MCLATSDPKVIDELRRISAVTAVRPVTQSIMYASIVVPFPTPLVHLLPLSLPHHHITPPLLAPSIQLRLQLCMFRLTHGWPHFLESGEVALNIIMLQK